MKRPTKIILGVVAGGLALASVSAAVVANERKAQNKELIMASGGYHGHGKFAGHRDMRKGMIRLFNEHDVNKDGAVTQAEVDDVRKAKVDKYDRDKDGSLSLSEFEALWLEQMRSVMVDGFQRLDDDGSGKITVEEFAAPFSNIIDRHDDDDDGDVDEEELEKHMKSKGKWRHNRG